VEEALARPASEQIDPSRPERREGRPRSTAMTDALITGESPIVEATAADRSPTLQDWLSSPSGQTPVGDSNGHPSAAPEPREDVAKVETTGRSELPEDPAVQ
jgi:hypothetical protein